MRYRRGIDRYSVPASRARSAVDARRACNSQTLSGPSAVRRRRFSLGSIQQWVRGTELVKRSPVLLRSFRAVWRAFDLVRVRKDRSYVHGLLFDLRGGLYSTEGMAFRIAPEQFPRSYRSRLYFDIYEAPERALAQKWIQPDSSVLELGGCIGVVSCVVNQLLESPERHLVIEANPTLIPLLRENRDANGCLYQIENCIVSRAPEAEFYIGGIMTANRKDSAIGKSIKVESQTLESLEERHAMRFDTLIMDIEGGEFDFFTENAARLADMKLVILELHTRILSAHQVGLCTSVLEHAGLRRVDVRGETDVWARPGPYGRSN
ncbi:FkbM family methyltransferase [Mycolicibacterium moriokaense]|nr:FkbM family methyltransferase [Mycolicibacterium moriokaense]